MQTPVTLDATNEQELWNQIGSDLRSNNETPFQYAANINRNGKVISLMIDIDPGGGFEGSMETTLLSAPVPVQFTSLKSDIADKPNFRFVLHDESFIDKVGKFFGMEDIETGFAEFDKKIIIKTNDPSRLATIFGDAPTRHVFEKLGSFRLEIAHYEHENNKASLELMIDRGITSPEELRPVFDAFVQVLEGLEKSA